MGFQTMLILDPYCMTFNAEVAFGLDFDFILKWKAEPLKLTTIICMPGSLHILVIVFLVRNYQSQLSFLFSFIKNAHREFLLKGVFSKPSGNHIFY